MQERKKWLALSLAAGIFIGGCGAKQVVRSEAPGDHPAEAPMTQGSLKHYIVKKHDTLWAIAAKSSVYGDAFEWPLLYKENRDKIQDPDLIYPHQSFQYTKQIPTTEEQEAKKLADETPRYAPHDKPRAKLPVVYF